jgi:hypothetical protein
MANAFPSVPSVGTLGTVAPRRTRAATNPFTPSRDDDTEDRGRILAHELSYVLDDMCTHAERVAKRRRAWRRRRDVMDTRPEWMKRERISAKAMDDLLLSHYMSYDNMLR